MRIDPNAPAYPQTICGRDNRGELVITTDPANPGLSIRAEIAKAAMKGIVAGLWSLDMAPSCTNKDIALDAIRIADALIAALNESEAKP